MFDSLGLNIMVPYPRFQRRYPFEDLIPPVDNTMIIHVGRMVDRGGIIDGVVERVSIIIKGVGIIIKRIFAIERVATFPGSRLRHFPFFADVWKVVGSM